MKYVSFSLWGDKQIYNIGAIRNAELISEVYPDWKMVVFYDDSVPINTIEELEKLNVKTVKIFDNSIYGMFWRFYVLDFPDYEYAIFRDADSRISLRESLAVKEWIESGKTLHVMRDHPYHKIPAGNNQLGILGGMWGIKKTSVSIIDMLDNNEIVKKHKYGNDQTFLKSIYDIFHNDKFTHDEFFEKYPFPIKRENDRFIGERIDEFDKPINEDYKLLHK